MAFRDEYSEELTKTLKKLKKKNLKQYEGQKACPHR